MDYNLQIIMASEDQNSDSHFRRKLLCIDSQLGSEDVECIKFLVTHLELVTQRKMEECKSALEIFDLFQQYDHLSKDNTILLGEILYVIKKPLLEHLKDFQNLSEEYLSSRKNILVFREKYNFLKILVNIDSHLGDDNVASLKFLCRDLVSQGKLKRCARALDVFHLLLTEKEMTEKDHTVLVELLTIVKKSLLQKFSYKTEDVERQRKIPLFRQLLYKLSINITQEDLKEMGFLVKNDIPGTWESPLDWLIRLEEEDKISETSLEYLEEIFERTKRSLLAHINAYKNQRNVQAEAPPENEPVQQMGESHSLSMSSVTDALPVYSSDDEHVNNNGDPANLPPSNPLEAMANPSKTNPDCYKMNGENRGLCVIVNNVEFDKQEKREGSTKDAETLKGVFEWLDFTTYIHTNVTKEELEVILKKYQKNPGHKTADCFVFCILSHGDFGCIFTSDDKAFSIKKILSHFTAQECVALAQKPKLFFIQACQGYETQSSITIKTDGKPFDPILPPSVETVPNWAHFLLSLSTVPGYVSFRDAKKGSWFIQSLCKHLEDMVPGADILTILTAVNKDVGSETNKTGTKKQMPLLSSTLYKMVKFPVSKKMLPQTKEFP